MKGEAESSGLTSDEAARPNIFLLGGLSLYISCGWLI